MNSPLWKLLWDYDPNGLVVLDTSLHIIQTNAAFCSMFKTDPESLHGTEASQLLGDVNDFSCALAENREVLGNERAYPDLDIYVRKVIFPVPGENVVAGIFVDLSHEWKQRLELQEMRERVAHEVSEVVDRQMKVAQEIAGLLGETTAETKVVLLRLLATMRHDD